MITKNSEFFHEISGLILFCLNQQDSRQRAGRNPCIQPCKQHIKSIGPLEQLTKNIH